MTFQRVESGTNQMFIKDFIIDQRTNPYPDPFATREDAPTPVELNHSSPMETFSRLLWHLPKQQSLLLRLRNTFRPRISTIGTGN